ncbi:hypothetical protein LPJ60_005371 [Coemansia sp. RSA 2675]|nr:hypothetical protein LPJ60_005371 [Coemansia sp. RSA 2675]
MAPRQKTTLATATPAAPTIAAARAQQAKYSQMDFNSLNIHVLRKYRQVFKLNVKARSSKDELVMAVNRHFSGHMVDEVDTIARFLYTVHRGKL